MGKIRSVTGMDPFGRDYHDSFTGKTGADAAQRGAQLQYDAVMEGIKSQEKGLEQQRLDLSPFRNLASSGGLRQFRKTALDQESYDYNPNADGLLNNALARTTRAVMDAQAAKGKLGSGSTLTSLMEAMAPIYMQRQGQDFEQRYNTNNQQFNQLQALTGMAQNAAAGQGAATQNATNAITELRSQGGNALAAGGIGAANASAQGASNAVGILGALGSILSDERLKEDRKRVGKMDDGTPIYTYKYKGGDGKTHMGVMAQEAKKKHPDAVRKHPSSNMLMVNYSRL